MRTPEQNTLKNMKDENGIVVTEEGEDNGGMENILSHTS